MKNKTNIDALKDLPPVSWWRLLIDGNRQVDGPLNFDEKEPGYLRGMMAGLNFVCANLDEPLTPEYLIQLHDTCVAPVRNVLTAESASGIVKVETSFAQGIYDAYKTFGLISTGKCKNFTTEGINQLRDKLLKGDTSFCFEHGVTDERISANNIKDIDLQTLMQKVNSGEWSIAIINSPQIDPIYAKIQTIINTYQENIAMAQQDEEKIQIIATCIHELELAHPFPDANCRTLVTLLTNQLLLQANLTPAVLENPNRFDAYSIPELCNEIRQGMHRFQQLCKTQAAENIPQFNHDPVIYIKNNDELTKLFIDSQLRQCPNWQEVNPKEKTKCIELIQEILTELKIDALNPEQIKGMQDILQKQVGSSIYEKNKILRLLKVDNKFGIMFAENANSKGLSKTALKTQLTDIFHNASKVNKFKKELCQVKSLESTKETQVDKSDVRPG